MRLSIAEDHQLASQPQGLDTTESALAVIRCKSKCLVMPRRLAHQPEEDQFRPMDRKLFLVKYLRLAWKMLRLAIWKLEQPAKPPNPSLNISQKH